MFVLSVMSSRICLFIFIDSWIIKTAEASVVLYKTASDIQCKQITPFFDTLCARFSSINFFKVNIQSFDSTSCCFIINVLIKYALFDEKVDLDESPIIASAENVRVVPTIKIYKKGNRVKEMVCPSPEVLESSLRHYSF